jgi:hypothetical protein
MSAWCLSPNVVVSAAADPDHTEDAMPRIGYGPMAVRAAKQMIDEQVRDAEVRRVARLDRREVRTSSAQVTAWRRWRIWSWAVRTPHAMDA